MSRFLPILKGRCPLEALEADLRRPSPGLLPASTYDEKVPGTPAFAWHYEEMWN